MPRWVVAVAAVALVAAACGGDDDDASSTTAAAADEPAATTTTSGTASGVNLAGVCPDPLVMQMDWEPESEHGGLYQLVGDGYTIDTDAKRVRGPMVASGEATGIDIEIRIGGNAVGFQQTGSLMYQDPDIFLGMIRLVEAMEFNEDLPVVAVYAMFEKSPFSVYWDPETYPNAETVADLKDEGVVIMLGRPDSFQDYWLAEGIMDESQMDLSDMGKPAAFIGRNGEWAEAGFATAEPFLYEFEVPEWGKPVKVQLIHDTGWEEYFQAMAVRTEDLTAEADCLEALVPIMQQAAVDYYADSGPTLEFILELVDAYDTGWIYTQAGGDFSTAKQLELGIVSNGANAYIGDFDADRVANLQRLVGEVTEIDVSGLTAEDVYTNEFIDTSIGLGG
ncbi:MAG TPA: hypothetical protein VLG28_13640 [Acidimicrobiia bacterium]|nr:hypothetical protein [Acidimicrobiia bacterium]